MPEEGIELAVSRGWAQGDGFSGERLGESEGTVFEADPAIDLDLPELIVRRVFEGRDAFVVGSRTQAVAVGGDGICQRLVRPLCIVDMTPRIERGLGMARRAEEAPHGFGLEAAVEALVLAERLGVIGPGMADPDAMFDQPDGQGRERIVGGRPPRRTIVHGDPPRQPIAPESGDKPGLDGRSQLIEASPYVDGKARMIVEDGQGIEPFAQGIAQRDMALEVHLPQIVGGRVLEANEAWRSATKLAERLAVPR